MAEGRWGAYQPSLEKAEDSVQEKGEGTEESLFPVPRGLLVPSSLFKIEKLFTLALWLLFHFRFLFFLAEGLGG